MTIVLVISIALSISAMMESIVFAKLQSADKFIMSLVCYLFIILFLTIVYTGSVQKDQNRYLFSVFSFLLFMILSWLRNWNTYSIKRISLNSTVLASAIFLIWEVGKLGFVQDKFTSGDSYSYAFGALDLNSQGDLKFSDWSKFMTSIQAFIPALVYFTNTLQSSTSKVEINVIMTAISVTSTVMILLTWLTAIRIIVIEIRNVPARIMLITTATIFLTSNFVFGPLSVGTALNAGISHLLILTAYFVYLLSRNGLISQKFTIQISMILNILVLMNYPLLIPLSASLTLYMIFVKKENFINFTSIFLFALFISYTFQVINSLIKHNSNGLGGSFASYNFKFYFVLFLLAGSIQLIVAKFDYWILYYPFTILLTFFYISLPYIKKNGFDLNYYNTKYLYLLMVPILVILMVNIYQFIEKTQNKYLFLVTVLLLFVLSTLSSISNNSLIVNNLQTTSMRNSLNNLAKERKERLYYVNYVDQNEELLLNLWADTRNIDYSTPWVIGNNQSKGVSLIFSDWQSHPEDRICNYIRSFPNALIISKSEVDVFSATKVCLFDFELR